ncbi:hypothetical protein Ferp_0538 [Ferroglobus placidus DSM 10642]|uniref:Uncharacterized protein n=1 Tax=Ferroglobus placidus (strain DSM 10642 / AEDII12DO) TaxID=589924 RepID=D3S379_FERPA|nr:hypothetical protein [Ferroglobus placidus]ADC64712.1 hypothetical protein Ferp_0538 [Ferroglobus placidus DSM 10642]
MGNLYFVTEDGEVYDDSKDIPEGKPSIMVHGWRDLEKVLHKLESGEDFLEIASRMCSMCGGFAENGDCRCGNFTPQLIFDDRGCVIRYTYVELLC